MMDIFKEYERLFHNLQQFQAIEWMGWKEAQALHDYIMDSVGVGCPGVRDSNTLHNIFFKTPYLDQYNDSGEHSLYDVAATYMWETAAKHPFNDGNKRTAIAAALTFLRNNGIETKFDPVLLEQLVKRCANSQSYRDGSRVGYSFPLSKAREEFLKCRV